MDDQPGFEDALAQLEARVRKLESGDVPLDEALRLFEEGVALARSCHTHLDTAEDRVSQLLRSADGIEERPLPDQD